MNNKKRESKFKTTILQCRTSKKPIWNTGGTINSLGYGRDVGLETTFEYYTKSANRFSKDGMIKIGLMYVEG